MKKVIGALTLGVALAASSVTAAEAASKSYKVSIKTSKSSSEVGHKIKISGTVSGESSKRLKGKKVTVQRKYGNGKWAKIGTTKIKSGGKYSLTTKLARGGNTSFRVIKSKSGKIRARASSTRTVRVYKWIDLTRAPHFIDAEGATNTAVMMKRRTYPRALQSLNSLSVIFRTAKACTTLTTYTGFRDKDTSNAASTDKQVMDVKFGEWNPTHALKQFVTPRGTVAKRTVSVAGAEFVNIEVDVPSNNAASVLASPRMRCNLNNLPAFHYEDMVS